MAVPCIGLDGAGSGLLALHVPFQLDYVFDINEKLRRVLGTIHGPAAANFNLGPVDGDILLQDISSWHRVDAIVCGPPCQPDSHMGVRRREDDERASVLDKVTAIIADQGRKGAYFFIIEMVGGMMDRRTKQGLPSRYHVWLTDVTTAAPMFNIVTWDLNTADYLPQHRRRLYTVGINRDFVPRVPINPPMPLGAPLQLADVLATGPGLPRDQEATLSPIKRNDLLTLVEISKARMAPTSRGSPFWMTLPLDRDMEKTWGMHVRVDGLVETLRTEDEFKWITHVGGHPFLSRCLHPVERLTLQGFPTSLAAVLSKQEVLLHTGNAFSVPVVAAVLSDVCCMLHDHGLFRLPGIPRQVEDRGEVAEAIRTFRRARAQELHWEIQAELSQAQALRRRFQ